MEEERERYSVFFFFFSLWKFSTIFTFHDSYCLFTLSLPFPFLFLYLCRLQRSFCYRRFLVKNKWYSVTEKYVDICSRKQYRNLGCCMEGDSKHYSFLLTGIRLYSLSNLFNVFFFDYILIFYYYTSSFGPYQEFTNAYALTL